MKRLRYTAALLFALAAAAPFQADEKKDDGFVPMFNGKDLTGWVNVNCAPGTFFVKDGMVITTGKPTGFLRTEKQYENFIADFEWMHVPPTPGAVGNSGFFVWADPLPAVGTGYTRGIEVQVLVNLEYGQEDDAITATSHGDLFSIWGADVRARIGRTRRAGRAACRARTGAKGANEWNHYRVEANDGVIKLAVNGKVVSGVSKCKPAQGLPRPGIRRLGVPVPQPQDQGIAQHQPEAKGNTVADVAQGHKSLFTGLDLSGWKADEETKKHWTARRGAARRRQGKGVTDRERIR